MLKSIGSKLLNFPPPLIAMIDGGASHSTEPLTKRTDDVFLSFQFRTDQLVRGFLGFGRAMFGLVQSESFCVWTRLYHPLQAI